MSEKDFDTKLQVTVSGGDSQTRSFVHQAIHDTLVTQGFQDIVHGAGVGLDWTNALNQTGTNHATLFDAVKSSRPEMFKETIYLNNGTAYVGENDGTMADEMNLGTSGNMAMVFALTEHPLTETEEETEAEREARETSSAALRAAMASATAASKLGIRQELFDELDSCGMLRDDEAVRTFIQEGSKQMELIAEAGPRHVGILLEEKGQIYGANRYAPNEVTE